MSEEELRAELHFLLKLARKHAKDARHYARETGDKHHSSASFARGMAYGFKIAADHIKRSMG